MNRYWLPATRPGVEQGAVIMIVGLRLATLAEMAPAIPSSLHLSPRPWLDAVLIAAVYVEALVAMGWIVRKRTSANQIWATVEVFFGLAWLVLEPLYVSIGERESTWMGWAPIVSANIVFSAAVGFRKARYTYLAATALAVAYILGSSPEIGHGTTLGTVAGNTVAYFTWALLGRVFVGYTRKLGSTADAAHAAAVDATRRLEIERSRRLLHDPASLLRYLADPDLDPRLVETVRTQALAEANRIRTFLSDSFDPGQISPSNGERFLIEVVRSTASEFSDLPIEQLVDLADGVVLSADQAHAVQSAMATVFHNVRIHAGPGAETVVHAELNATEQRWEVTIRDNGIGFDDATTPQGYGLSQLVGAALREHGIDSEVHSQPGLGTTVTLVGPQGGTP